MTATDNVFSSEVLGFDPDALARRYAEEREKRIRPDAEEQFLQLSHDSPFTNKYLEEDPYCETVERAPLKDEREVIVIGGGWVGMLTAARLVQAGINDVRIIESGGDFGGTWYWNRYPGAQCDIESYSYLPLLEETGYVPKLRFSYASEIYEHAQRIGRHFDLYRDAVFQTWVTELRWLEEESMWLVSTNRGDEMRARHVCLGTGPANRPRLPGIPGVETFKGHSFHTCRWDYDYTGGGPEGGLTGLADKTVAIIGTGATAVQCVPALGEGAKQLYVFQRTPSSVDVRNNAETDPEWAKNLKPGWQKERLERHVLGTKPDPEKRKAIESMDRALRTQRYENHNIEHQMRLHRRIEEIVENPETAEKLKPWYMHRCKRPTYDDEYLPAFNIPSVQLVDTDGQGITEINENGPVFDGQEYPVDVLIFATGFEVQVTGIYNDIRGVDGLELNDKYKDGMRTVFGIHSAGYPNLFIMGGYQASFQFNLTFMLQTQGFHIAECIKYTRENGYATIDAKSDTEKWWVGEVIKFRGTTNRNKECTPGYYNFEGEDNRREDGNYNGGMWQYCQHLDESKGRYREYFDFQQ